MRILSAIFFFQASILCAWAQDYALEFDGTPNQHLHGTVSLVNVSNSFTMEMWVNPTATHTIYKESCYGYDGLTGQRFAVWPEGYHFDQAGAGISVGTNGVSVYEHCVNVSLNPILVWNGRLSGCTHIAVVYENKTPSLYVNGQLVRTGLTSIRTAVHPSAAYIGDPSWGGVYAGRIDDIRIWDMPLTAQQINERKNVRMDNTDPLWSHVAIYLPFDEGSGLVTYDVSTSAVQYQLINDPDWVDAALCVIPEDYALEFDGTPYQYLWRWMYLDHISNDFTMEFWVNPTAPHEIDTESNNNGYEGLSGQRYTILPQGHQFNEAGAGISVGTNGVSVYEHCVNVSLNPILVWNGQITGCTHVAVVYQDKTPSLYINGQLVHTGMRSIRTSVHPSGEYFGDPAWGGAFAGKLDDIRIWDIPLSPQQINEQMHVRIDNADPLWNHIAVYLPMEEGSGALTQDISPNAWQYQLVGSPGWIRGHFNAPIITSSLFIPVNPGGEPNTIYLGYGPQSVVLTASGGTSYSWSPSTGLSCADCASPAASPTSTTTYTVTAANPFGCTATASYTINVVDVRCGNNLADVIVCHRCQSAHTVCIGSSAVQAHLNHGDYLGECAEIPKEPSTTAAVPASVILEQNHPNPFNPSTTIRYGVPEDGPVLLRVFDVHERLVAELVNEYKPAGTYSVDFVGGKLPSGMYLYRIETAGEMRTGTMILMK